MGNPAQNPLFKHFRQPALYLKLPSMGQYYPAGAIDMPANGEIPVYPMTVKDELTLKTPDALLNGKAVVDVVQSCCPNIKDPWAIPSVDMDPILIAIRIASYGEGMDITTICPHCQSSNDHEVDLRTIIANAKASDYSRPLFADELKFKFKPQTYKNINDITLINFEEQRLIDSVINNPGLSDDEKAVKFAHSFNKLKELNINTIVVCIESITTKGDDGNEIVVTDQKMIFEFIENTSREMFNSLKEKITNLIDSNKLEAITLTCGECHKEYKNNLEFNQSNFFASGF